MKERAPILAFLALLAFWLAGCRLAPSLPSLGAAMSSVFSGTWRAEKAQGVRAGAPDARFGFLHLTVQWPGKLPAYRSQLLPDSTARIDVDVLSAGAVVATGSVTRDAGQATRSLTITVPAGSNLSVSAYAKAAGGDRIARGTAAGFNVVRGGSTRLAILMFPLSFPAIESLDYNAGAVGSTITLTGSNFKPAWAADPTVVLEGSAGASVSATVTAATDAGITFTVPANAAVGRVEVVADGVGSLSSATLWVVSGLSTAATRAPGDNTNSVGSRTLVWEDAIDLTATHSWSLRSDRTAVDYGTTPLPTWSLSSAKGAIDQATGLTTTFTATPSSGTGTIRWTLGATSSPTTGLVVAETAFAQKSASDMIKARVNLSLVAIGSYLYAIGGNNGADGTMASIERAPVDASDNVGTFTSAGQPSLTGPRRSHAALVVGDYLYVFGGDDGTNDLRSAERAPIDASGNIGTFADLGTAGRLVTARSSPAAVIAGPYVYVIGGSNATDGFLASIERAPILDGQGNLGPFATYGKSLNRAHANLFAGVHGDALFVIGGSSATNTPTKYVEKAPIDASGNVGTFVDQPDLPAARAGHAGLFVRDMAFLLGGNTGSLTNSGVVGVFDSGNALPAYAATTASLTEVRGNISGAAVATGKWLYVAGGKDATTQHKSVDRIRIPVGAATGTLTFTVDPTPAPVVGPLSYAVTTVSGTGGYLGTATSVVVDPSGNRFVAVNNTNKIVKITAAGVVSNFVGSGSAASTDGTGAGAAFNSPVGIAQDSAGNLYVSEYSGHRIRKVSPTGEVTTLAGSAQGYLDNTTGTSAKLSNPYGLAVDANDNVYVADEGNHVIRRITPTGAVSTYAGKQSAPCEATPTNGATSSATFCYPAQLTLDTAGNLYVTDRGSCRIRKITPTGTVSTLAGSGGGNMACRSGSQTKTADGTGAAAAFNQPYGIAFRPSGELYVSDAYDNVIRQVTPTGEVTTPVGSPNLTGATTDGTGAAARFSFPTGLAFDMTGIMFVADQQNQKLRKVQ
ncbi:MAG: hypothetical protein FJZ01_08755 [Candidatus Sericytochromatia bacterium]|nr:hypothetical protein [Candidatus Tanganyikabacteria bacterium]